MPLCMFASAQLCIKFTQLLRHTPGLDIFKHGEAAYPIVAYGHGWEESATMNTYLRRLSQSHGKCSHNHNSYSHFHAVGIGDLLPMSMNENARFENAEQHVMTAQNDDIACVHTNPYTLY
jgi:hypothetical protein